jgi:calcium channel MID1
LTDGNCKIIYDLPFCSNVAYAVPSNATAERAELVDFYDNNAAALYQNFSFSLQQIPCNTSSSAQYSLARNCDDCARDYKTWLCAVTIPRCTDFSTPNTPDFNFLMPRAVGQPSIDGDQVNLEAAGLNTSYTQRTYTNSSRVSLIDSVIKPGPYKELLPCEELCYNLVQSCPAALGFGCPKQGFMIQRSYGAYDPDRLLTDGTWTCNYLGIDWPNLNAAPGRGAASASLLLMVSVVHAVLVW